MSMRAFRTIAATFTLLGVLGTLAQVNPASGDTASSSSTQQAIPGQAPVAGPEVPITSVAPIPATPLEPPTAEAYVRCTPRAETSYGQTVVPVNFLANDVGASVGPLSDGTWRLLYFGHQLDFAPYRQQANFDGQDIVLTPAPLHLNGQLYVPLAPFARLLGFRWSIPKSSNPAADQRGTTILIQYSAAYIENIRSTVQQDKVHIVMELSNPTRVVAGQEKLDVTFNLAGARASAAVPSVGKVGDYLVAQTLLTSGDWRANLRVRLNYSAPVTWYTIGSPPRLVIDAQRLFEQTSQSPVQGSLRLTKIRRGTGHGPVQMWAVKLDPKEGWRVRVAPAGFSVLQRAQPSKLAARHKAVLAVNGGFFAYDGAALGAVLVDNEWLRLPWRGRTAVGFTADGTARIDNLQTEAYVEFGRGLKLNVHDLNGWPDKGRVTVLTKRFGTYYVLRPGEMAVVVKNGKVIAKPGGGGAGISAYGFTLVGSGGAREWLNKAVKGDTAKLVIRPIGWNHIVTALGGGPRLVRDGQLEITATREAFRTDVREGPGPRTAFGIDRQGRYIILVADGRQQYHSTGLTLTELAQTMQRLGAVNAMNLDGGGSSVMAVRGRVVNRPSDGFERNVSNALLVMR